MTSLYLLPTYHNHFPQNCGGERIFLEKGNLIEEAQLLSQRLPREPVRLLGWSYGGLVAWTYALRAPSRVHSLYILGSIPRLCDASWRFHLSTWFLSQLSFSHLWIQRLCSIKKDFPTSLPSVPVHWYLGKKDPFHHWKRDMLPTWEGINFYLHEGGQFPCEDLLQELLTKGERKER